MKAYTFFLLASFNFNAMGSNEPLRVEDWTLTSPFSYGVSKGLTFGFYDAKQPTNVISSMPTVAEMPVGLVSYVEQHNRFSTILGTLLGGLISTWLLITLFYGLYHRIKGEQ